MGGPRRLLTEDGKAVAFVEPYSIQLMKDRLFDTSDWPLNRDGVLATWAYVRDACERAGIRLHTSDLMPPHEQDGVVFPLHTIHSHTVLHHKLSHRQDILWGSCYVGEPPFDISGGWGGIYRELDTCAGLYKRVYTSASPNALARLPGIRGASAARHFVYPQAPDGVLEELWNRRERAPLVMVNSARRAPMERYELFTERVRAIAHFASRASIDLYGADWDTFPAPLRLRDTSRYPRQILKEGPGRVARDLLMQRSFKHIAKSYRGPCRSKYQTLSGYRFAICYENAAIDGYIMEKIFDCLFVGTIPIYLGDPDVASRIPDDCYIDRSRFSGYRALQAYLSLLAASDIARYRKAGREFLESDAFVPFSKEHFAQRFVEDTLEDLRLGSAVECGA